MNNISESLNEMEVLNISNMNSLDHLVLNDQRLLELIQSYPFLYNPLVKPFRDSDYDTWAWDRITTAFNRSYEGITELFSTQQLQQRWQTLQPIIVSLSKLPDITQIPEALRQSVIKISIQLGDQKTNVAAKPLTDAQSIILENIEMVARLPMNQLKRLESEMVDIILYTGLDPMGKNKIHNVYNQSLEKDQEDFFKAIRFDELFVIREGQCDSNDGNKVEEELILPDMVSFTDTSLIKREDIAEETFSNNWVPLHLAPKFVRACVVRVQRTNLEDYIPLSKIKRDHVL